MTKKVSRSDKFLWSPAEFSNFTSVSRTTASKMLANITPVGKDGQSPMYNAKECVELYVDYRLALHGDKKDITIRARKELADTLQREAKTQEMLGKLVSRRDIEADQSHMAGTVVRMIESIHGRIKRAVPEATPQVLAAVQKETQRIRNNFVKALSFEHTQLREDDPTEPPEQMLPSPPPDQMVSIDMITDRYADRDLSVDDEKKPESVDMAMFG